MAADLLRRSALALRNASRRAEALRHVGAGSVRDRILEQSRKSFAFGWLVVGLTIASTIVASPAAGSQNEERFTLTPAVPSISRPIVVDRTPDFSISVTAALQSLRVALVAPDGTRHVVGDRALGRLEIGLGAEYSATVAKPVPGIWALEVSAPEPLDTSIDVFVRSTFNNGVHLELAGGGSTYLSGTNARLALSLVDGVRRSRSVSIQATMSLPSDPTFRPVTVTFTDDGTGADALAGDGVYETFVNPRQTGTFQLQVAVDGVASTGAFRRSTASVIDVAPRRADITTFTGGGIDIDQDGLFDQIVVSPVAMILEDGEYLVTVRLRGSNGREIQRSVQTALTAGMSSADVLFDAADILSDVGVDGPYHVAQITFLHSTSEDYVPADIRDDIGDTDAYALVGLQPTLLRLAGGGTAAGVDVDGNGLFDRLDLTVDVIVDAAGPYSFSASLTDAAGNDVGFCAGTQVLESGTSTIALTIPGEQLVKHGADGPYRLSNLVLFGAGQSLIARHALTTAPFRVSQFEGE